LAGHGIETDVGLPEDVRFPPDVEALLFRTAQEALRNVMAHAAASRVGVQLSRPDHRAVLEVRDNGKGFDIEELPLRANGGHVGLRVLAELAQEAGATFNLRSDPGSGTTVHIEVPLQ
jgi:signal transduction histidine kinase